MDLYHNKWDVKNGLAYGLTFFSLISDGLGGVKKFPRANFYKLFGHMKWADFESYRFECQNAQCTQSKLDQVMKILLPGIAAYCKVHLVLVWFEFALNLHVIYVTFT